ncbi:MAG: extracellular solute-binding protein [Anaerolineae bacterium]|nr:extracellular solute-binding protein [Anaerolineae bacterium]
MEIVTNWRTCPKKQLLLGILLLLVLAGCQIDQDDQSLGGSVILWHSWPPEKAAVLEEAIAQFEEINPEVDVIVVDLPSEQILGDFKRAGYNGLGPGLLLGRNSWIGELADDGLIRPIEPYISAETLSSSSNRSLVTYRDQQYGLPIFLEPRALYYNTELVTNPPNTLSDLLAEASTGNRVAFVPRFEEAYWGIQAFGDGLFDAEGRFTLASSGFEEWLNWLSNAQNEPGVILSIDDPSLLDLFINGEIAYYVADPNKQKQMPDFIDEDTPFEYGVRPLPGGPTGDSGPLLSAETMMLYAYSTENQNRTAAALAMFLANRQQGIRFLRDIDLVPANPTINVDPRIYPVPNGFARQVRTAVVLPNEIPAQSFLAAGNRAYTSVLSGTASPADAVCSFGLEVIGIMNYTAEDVLLPQGCRFVDE